MLYSEAVVRRCSVKIVLIEISHNSQENTCVRVSFLINFQASACNFIKKKLWHKCFPVNFAKSQKFAKLLETSSLTEHLPWLLLYIFLQKLDFEISYCNRLVDQPHTHSQTIHTPKAVNNENSQLVPNAN